MDVMIEENKDMERLKLFYLAKLLVALVELIQTLQQFDIIRNATFLFLAPVVHCNFIVVTYPLLVLQIPIYMTRIHIQSITNNFASISRWWIRKEVRDTSIKWGHIFNWINWGFFVCIFWKLTRNFTTFKFWTWLATPVFIISHKKYSSYLEYEVPGELSRWSMRLLI